MIAMLRAASAHVVLVPRLGGRGTKIFSCVSFLCASFLPAALRAGASAHGVRLAFVMAPSCAGWAESLALLIVVLILEGA